jgi:hypothetical protein
VKFKNKIAEKNPREYTPLTTHRQGIVATNIKPVQAEKWPAGRPCQWVTSQPESESVTACESVSSSTGHGH